MTNIDMSAIEAITSLQRPGKPDLLSKILGLFEQNCPGSIDEIEQGLVNSDLEAVKAASHSMKSSAAYLGALELSEQCKQIERSAREEDLQACTACAEGLRSCYEESLFALKPLVAKAA